MEDSDELFDYIADLPSDNVLEICNFVLIGAGGGGGSGGGAEGNGVVSDDRVAPDPDSAGLDSSTVHYNNSFVEILDFQVEPANNNNNNNNKNDRIMEGQEKVEINLQHVFHSNIINILYETEFILFSSDPG